MTTTTTTPKFEMTHRHTALGFIVIASLCISLAVGFFSVATQKTTPGADLRATAPASCAQHTC